MAVTVEEGRAHLGMETPRQRHDRAIARPALALVSLYSIMPLTTPLLIAKGETGMRRTAW
jgi:hypothetical protein